MKHQHILDQLPLWVEGDLSRPEATEIEAHLAQCEACRSSAEALRVSQAWLKQPVSPPFSNDDRLELRRAVMARIRAESPRKATAFRIRSLFLVAAALVLGLLSTNLYKRHSKPSLTPVPLPAIAQRIPIAHTPPSRHQASIIHPRPVKRLLQPHPEPSTPALPGLSHIEIQISNPQVRIIWLVGAQAARTPPDESDPSI